MIKSSPNLRRRRVLVWAVAALVLAATAALLLLKMTPAVYRRTAAMGADETATLRFNEEVLNKVGNVYLDRSGRTPLALEFTEEMVNSLLAQSLDDEEAAGKAQPPALRDMRVGFEPGRLVVATRLGEGVRSVVVSQGFELSATEDGMLLVEPAGTAGGLLPLPGGLMDFIKRAIADQVVPHEVDDTDSRAAEDWRAVVLEALNGKPVPLGKGKKRIILDSVEIERGTLRVMGHRAVPQGNPEAQAEAKTVRIVGRVLEVHILGEKEETVMVCDVDPHYVVTVLTESGAKKLGIHSPALTFMGENPVGRSYRFYLSKTNNRFNLEKVEVINPDKTDARDVQ